MTSKNIRDMALELINAEKEYFAASIEVTRLHKKLVDASNTLANQMIRDESECVIVDGRVVIFNGHDFDIDEKSITHAFSVYTPWEPAK